MPTSNTLPEMRSDQELLTALTNIIPILNAQKATLGLSTQQVTDITNAINTYQSGYNANVTAKNAAKASTTTKDLNRKACMNIILPLCKQWRANLAVPDALLEQLFLAPHNNTPTKTPPVTPTGFKATVDGQGLIKLAWKTTGNKPTGTLYIVETRFSATADWDVDGAASRGAYEYEGVPGQYVAFRVYAQRGKEKSQPTLPIVLWEGGSTSTGVIQLAA